MEIDKAYNFAPNDLHTNVYDDGQHQCRAVVMAGGNYYIGFYGWKTFRDQMYITTILREIN